MIFDITDLDKIALIKSLFHFAVGDSCVSISNEECKDFLEKFSQKRVKQGDIIDYYNNKAIKLHVFEKNSRWLAFAEDYDEQNGLFRFFEAMLNTFLLKDIIVVKKNHSFDSIQIEKQTFNRPKKELVIFKNILKGYVSKSDLFGRYWALEEIKREKPGKHQSVEKKFFFSKGNHKRIDF